ncbi:hypothetical protein IQ232_16395 [Microcystis aeruginosa LEGE 11464]|uniref:CFI-box-CTERM domain-containing protein n=1 Tax=Microcystis aeruginosa TaxID=1126 RepID=UPI0018817F1A|nr:CFI-box-CTERM domain-containing protein [Microcystis aeruginosa]MBE9091277.1 hypothetical protein [Microcystis aeruginosa LEGE 11464]
MSNFDQQNQVVYNQVNQVINQQIINNNYIVNDELVEIFLENITTLIPLDADPSIKKSLVLQIIFECANSGHLPISPEEAGLIVDKLNKLSILEFKRLLSSDVKYKKLRNRLGWYIVGGIGGGYTVGKVDLKYIIHELISNNDLYDPGWSNPFSDSSDSQKHYNPGEQYRGSIPGENISRLGLSHEFVENDLVFPPKSVSSVKSERLLEPEGSRSGGDYNNSGEGGEPELDLDIDSEGCFIATAVYGSEESPQVVILRNFRDKKLMPYAVGRLLVTVYYQLSPPLVKRFKHSPNLVKLVRYILDQFVVWLGK